MTIKQSNFDFNRLQKLYKSANTKAKDLLNLINQAELGIFITDQNVNYLHINKQAAKILGYTNKELYKIPLIDLTPKDELENIANRALERLAGKPQQATFESTILHKNGKKIPIQVSSSTIIWEGKPARIALFYDVSRIKLLDNSSKNKNETYSQLIDNTTCLLANIDPSGNILFINKAYCKFFNKTESELSGESFNSIIHTEDHKSTKIILKDIGNKSPNIAVRQRGITKDGLKWLEWIFTAIFDKNKKITNIVAVGRDISNQWAIEDELIKSEKKYRERFNRILDPFSSSSIDGKLLEYNDEFGKTAGFDPKKDYTGYKLSTRWRNKTDRKVWQNKLTDKDYVQNYQIKMYDVNNKKLDLYMNAILIRDKNDNPIRVECTYFDNTKHIQLHNKLIDNQYLLKEKVKNRTKELNDANKILKNQNTELLQIEKLIKLQNKQLEQKNITLNELMSQVTREKENIAEKVHLNIEKLILPFLNKLKNNHNDNSIQIIDTIEHNLESITTSFGLKLTNVLQKLSPREVEICNFIRSGLSTKEISKLLNISETTVVSHRNHIRRKLKIQNTKINLASYLMSL